jgi:hypothetical protein
MNDKHRKFLIMLGLKPEDWEQTEVIETKVIYQPVVCKEHKGRMMGCVPCLQQIKGLRRRRVVHVA